jgi:YtcA family
MITNKTGRLSRFGLLLGAMLSTSCSRAPSFDILGSFFPAWLLCLVLGLLLTVAARWLFLYARVVIALPVLTYPSLTALFTFVLWLAWFR